MIISDNTNLGIRRSSLWWWVSQRNIRSWWDNKYNGSCCDDSDQLWSKWFSGEYCNDGDLHDLRPLSLLDGFPPRPGFFATSGWFYLDLHIWWKLTQIILIIVAITRHLFTHWLLLTLVVYISNFQGRGEEQSEKYCNEARNSQNWRRRLFGLVSPFSGVSLHLYHISPHKMSSLIEIL